jgi:hypothetical protein
MTIRMMPGALLRCAPHSSYELAVVVRLLLPLQYQLLLWIRLGRY